MQVVLELTAQGGPGNRWMKEGTEAAAATAVVMAESAIPEEPVEVMVDHPFLFLIRDIETGAILFMGRVVDPSA